MLTCARRLPLVLTVVLLACSNKGAAPADAGAGDSTRESGMDTAGPRDGRAANMDGSAAVELLDGATGTRGSVTATPVDEAEAVYDQAELRTYTIDLSDADLAKLDADPLAEEYVPATLNFEGKSYGPVGIRYKGSVGGFVGCTSNGGFPPSGSKTCPKLSMKVSFDWQDPDARFFGLKKLLFHSMNSDESLMRDRLAYALFREMGVPAPRASHARVVINGKLAGLFALIEQVDGRYTRARFSDGGEGNLYKEVWPIHLTDQVYLDALETNETEQPSAIKMRDFAYRLGEATSDAELAELIDARMDRQVTLSYVAVDRTIRNDDGAFHWYCGVPPGQGNNPGPWGNHNYYFYEESSSNQLWIIPWDMDLSFRGEANITPIIVPWNELKPDCSCMTSGSFGTGQRAPSCDPLIRGWAGMETTFQSRVRAFLDGPLSREQVDGKLEQWALQVAPVVEEAAILPGQLSVVAWNSALEALRDEIDSLRAEAEASAP